MQRFVCAAALAALTACATPTYDPPAPKPAEIAAARLGAATFAFTRYERQAAEQQLLLQAAERRIRAAATELCPDVSDGDCSFSVRLDDSDLPNAFVDEEGKIRITDALLRFLGSEDEVAFVVAHEFAHRIADHAAEGERNARIAGTLAAILLGGLSVAAGPPGLVLAAPAAHLGYAAGERLGGLGYSKAQEREADYLGAYLVARAGYDVGKAGRVMENLAALEVQHPAAGDQPGVLGFFATHPSSPERAARMRRIAAEIADKRKREEALLPARPSDRRATPSVSP